MATSSKKNDEFFALAMACRSILHENWKSAQTDHGNYPEGSGKSFIGQMRKTFFTNFAQKRLFGLRL
jgi:hypothetical protein